MNSISGSQSASSCGTSRRENCSNRLRVVSTRGSSTPYSLRLLDGVVRGLARRRDARGLRRRRAAVLVVAADPRHDRRGNEHAEADDDQRDQDDRAHPEDDQDDPQDHEEQKEKSSLHAQGVPATAVTYARFRQRERASDAWPRTPAPLRTGSRAWPPWPASSSPPPASRRRCVARADASAAGAPPHRRA